VTESAVHHPSAGDLTPALRVLEGAPPGWEGDASTARDGLAWLVALPGPPRRDVLAAAWPRRAPFQLAAACLEPSWGVGTAREPLALAAAEAILLGWWCQAETVLVAHRLLAEVWQAAEERIVADPGRMDAALPPVICFLPAAESGPGYVATPTVLGHGPDRLVAVLVVRDRPSLVAWDAAVAALFERTAPGWPGRLSPRMWSAALWARPDGGLARSAGPVQGWDGARWRTDHPDAVALSPGGQARSATRLALALLGTLADDPGRLVDPGGDDGVSARLAG
jgi:hypothetical protein